MYLIPIRIKKISDENDDEDNSYVDNKINILDNNMNDHCRYILYDIYNQL